MGTFIGTIGGLLMAILIVILAFVFLREMGWLKNGKEIGKIALVVTTIGVLELCVAGVYRTMMDSNITLLNIHTIWKRVDVLGEGIAPFHWYIGLLVSNLYYWNIYQFLKNALDEKKAFAGLLLVLAFPCAQEMFLPSILLTVMTIVILVLRMVDKRTERAISKALGRGLTSMLGTGSHPMAYCYTLLLFVVANAYVMLQLIK